MLVFSGIWISSPQPMAIYAAMEAARPSMYTILRAAWAFSWLIIARPSNTLPPMELIRISSSATLPISARSWAKSFAAIPSSLHQSLPIWSYSRMVARLDPAWALTAFQNLFFIAASIVLFWLRQGRLLLGDRQ